MLPRIKDLYNKGENIIQFLRNEEGREFNTIDDILISYDLQAGSYVKFVKENPVYTEEYTNAIVEVFKDLGAYNSILEAGAGEATTLGNVIRKINNPALQVIGFDISWSRINCWTKYLKELNVDAELFVGDIFNVPLGDNSVDVVYTSHSIEPNGGKEKEALSELYRIAKKYLVLLEPTDEFANESGKMRMQKNGYIRNLKKHIIDLQFNLIAYKPFPVNANALNPTGLYIIKKEGSPVYKNEDLYYYCPISKCKLTDYQDHLFCRESLLSYPKIMGIPCLCSSYAVLTSGHEQ